MCPSTSAIHTARYIESIQIRSVPFDNSIADTVYGIQYKNNRVALVQCKLQKCSKIRILIFLIIANELQSLTPALQAKEVANKK